MTSSTKYKKPQYKTESVVLDTGEKVDIGRTSLANLEALLEVQDRLLGKYVQTDGSMYKLMTDSDVVADLTTMCNFLPIVGKAETYLNFEDIQDNWEQTVILFFNAGYDPETRKTPNLQPSKVSQLHFLPFMEMLEKHLQAFKENEDK